MQRSWRWYLAWGTLVASLSMLVFMATAGPAHAWPQEVNAFTDAPSGYGPGSGECGNDSSHPCLYWKEPHYTSITLVFVMDPSLRSSQSKGYDFYTAINTAFTQYNNAPAWNPYMTQCFDFCQGIVGTYYMSSAVPCGRYAETPYLYSGTIKYGYNPQRGGNEWYSFFVSSSTRFNSTVFWNNSFDWSGESCSTLHGDGRATATHESGHAVGLGHTNDCPSVMSGACLESGRFYQLSTNSDIAALKAIYPGNQQAS